VPDTKVSRWSANAGSSQRPVTRRLYVSLHRQQSCYTSGARWRRTRGSLRPGEERFLRKPAMVRENAPL